MSHKLVGCALVILCLSLATTILRVNSAAGVNPQAAGLYSVAYNPYAEIDWNATFRLKTQLHCHTTLSDGGDQPYTMINQYAVCGFDALGISDHDLLTWPWTDWSEYINQEAWNMVAIPNEEVSMRTVHFTAPFLTAAVDGKDYRLDVQGAINAAVAVGGIPIIAHPWFMGFDLTTADPWTGFQGIEIYNPTEGGFQPFDFQLWDHLLTDPARAQKHIWGFAADDAHATEDINQGWIVVYPSQKDASSVKDSIIAGSFIAVVNSTHLMNSITQVGGKLIVDTDSSVVWKADGEQIVGTNSTLDLDTLGPGYTYVRAEVDNATIFTQPIFITQTSPYTIFSNGFDDGFASWSNTVRTGLFSFIGQSADTARSGSYSEKIAGIHYYGDKAYANKSLGAAYKRINMRAYVNFSTVSTTGIMHGPLSLSSSDYYVSAVVRNFTSNKWGIQIYSPETGEKTYWENGTSAVTIKTWYYVELEAMISAHGFSTLWVNGAMKLNATDINFGASTITSVGAGEYYTTNDLSNVLTFYVDDIVVADSYIGPIQYGLTVGIYGHGVTNATGTHTYVEFTNVTVSAIPDSGWNLDHWELNSTVYGASSLFTVNMTANYDLAAVFSPVQLTLTANVAGHGTTNVTGAHAYDQFTNVTVLATPNSGSFFDHWLLNGTNVGSGNSHTVNMTANYNLTAVFLAFQRNLTVTVVGSGSTNATGTFTYDEFSNVTVLATPDLGYKLDHWLLNGSNVGLVNPYTLNMTANFDLTVVFTPIDYNLFVDTIGHGITNATGTHAYGAFVDVSVLATPDSGYYLFEWLLNGTNVGSANPYTVTMIQNYNLTAVFAPVQFSLTVNVSGQGSTNATGTFAHDPFTNVTVLATPAPGYFFDYWILNSTNVGSINPCTINMTSNYDLTAVFSAVMRSLTVNVVGHGITNATGTYSYAQFTNVTVSAIPDSGYHFDHWVLNGSNVGSDNPYTINMTANFDLTAMFSPIEYNLFVGVSGHGVTNITGTNTYAAFTDVPVLGTPDSGFYLSEWLVNGTSVGSANPYTVSMNQNYNLTAVFMRTQYSLTISISGHGSTNATGTFAHDALSNVTVSATPDPGWNLDHWILNGTDYGATVSFTVNMTANYNLTAVFNPPGIYLVVRGANNLIYYRGYNPTSLSWENWSALPEGATADSPASALVGNNLYVVVRGMNDDQIWFSYINLTDSTFSGWTLLSGATPSTPALTSNSTTLCLVVRGETNLIWYRFYDLGSEVWSDWASMPDGATYDTPAATLLGDTLQIVVRGANNDEIWHSYVNLTDSTFSGWTLLDGATPSAPTLTTNGTSVCLVVRGASDVVWYRFYNFASKVWGDWTSVPDGATPDSPAAILLGGTLQIVVRGMSEDQIWHESVNLSDNSFSGWTLLDGATPSKPTLTS